jgi:anion-transporting  ArsA/GET3 family ATPase
MATHNPSDQDLQSRGADEGHGRRYAAPQMEVAAFCRESRVLIVAGKGGVGKTTISAALARMASDAGLSVLLVELEGRTGIGSAFGRPHAFDYEESELAPPPGPIRGRRLTPDDALLEYLTDHGLHRVSKRIVSSGVLDVVATAIPGIRDVLILGKVKQLERAGVADLIVVDAPATGHAITFLTSARGLIEAARGGPVRSQAVEVDELLQDPARCRVLLVCLAEELPVSETVEAARLLQEKAGTHLGPVVVNDLDEADPALAVSAAEAADRAGVALDPPQLEALDAARVFRLHRQELATHQAERLAQELPLPQLHVPHIGAETIGPAELQVLADALARGIGSLAVEAPR